MKTSLDNPSVEIKSKTTVLYACSDTCFMASLATLFFGAAEWTSYHVSKESHLAPPSSICAYILNKNSSWCSTVPLCMSIGFIFLGLYLHSHATLAGRKVTNTTNTAQTNPTKS